MGNQISMHIPKICAWCGMRQGEKSHPVSLSYGSRRYRTRLRFDLPICSECNDFVEKRKKAEGSRGLWTFIGSVVLSLIIGFVLVGPQDFLPVSFVVLAVVLMLAYGGMSISGLAKTIDDKATGPKPEGYTSETSHCCKMVSHKLLEFTNPTFHQSFATLNPTLVQNK